MIPDGYVIYDLDPAEIYTIRTTVPIHTWINYVKEARALGIPGSSAVIDRAVIMTKIHPRSERRPPDGWLEDHDCDADQLQAVRRGIC
jgi:hypothetical protein